MKHGFFYNLRRKGQQAAAQLFSEELISRLYYRVKVGRRLHIHEPKTFTEKLQWLKLYYCPQNPKVIQCADKYAVREYIRQLGEDALLNDLIGVWDRVEDICWDTLPDQFVLKCNHGCGYNILCPDKSKLDVEQAKEKLKKWMGEDYALYDIEPHYGKIPRKIICEKYLGPDVVNYNMYCFHGEPVFFSLASGLGDGTDERLTYFYADGQKAEFWNRAYPTDDAPLSPMLPQMVECARRLSGEFPLVRVDLFDIGGRLVLSELTFTPGGAIIPIEPYASDLELGRKLDISPLMKQWEADRAGKKALGNRS